MRQLILAITLLGMAASTSIAQDLIKVSPNAYKLEFENDQVRVLRFKRRPFEKIPMHEHPTPFVVVFLTDAHQRFTSPDGKVVEATRKAGEALFNQPIKHAEEELTDKPLEVILIELKPKASPGPSAAVPAAVDPVNVDPKHHKVEFENNLVRIIRSDREGYAKVPMHSHPGFVVVYLSEIHSNTTLADGTKTEGRRKAGEIAWRGPVRHATDNLSDQHLVELQVELKSAPVMAK